MKHSQRLSKIKKERKPLTYRKIVVNDEVFWWKVMNYSSGITILNKDRKEVFSDYWGGKATIRPSDVARMIKVHIYKETIPMETPVNEGIHLTKSEAITLFNMADLILINGRKVYEKGSTDDFHTYYLKAHDMYYNDIFIVSNKGVYKHSDGHITIPGYIDDCKVELFKNLFNQ